MRTACVRQRRRQGSRGQTSTEYMLLVSTLVVALAAASYYVFDSDNSPVQQGMDSLLSKDSSSDMNVPKQVQQGFISKNP